MGYKIDDKIEHLIQEVYNPKFIDIKDDKTGASILKNAGRDKLDYIKSKEFIRDNSIKGSALPAAAGAAVGGNLGLLSSLGTDDDDTIPASLLGTLGGAALGAGHGYFSTRQKSTRLQNRADEKLFEGTGFLGMKKLSPGLKAAGLASLGGIAGAGLDVYFNGGRHLGEFVKPVTAWGLGGAIGALAQQPKKEKEVEKEID